MQEGCGFVVICPEPNFALARLTSQNLRCYFPDSPVRFVLPPRGDDGDAQRIKTLGPSVMGGNTITGLINEGVGGSSRKWNFVLVCGGMVSPNVAKKYFWFCRTDKDILFPVVDRKMFFDECSINGILLHKAAFDEVGPIPESEDIWLSKLDWSARAVEKGYQFKAIVGAKFM